MCGSDFTCRICELPCDSDSEVSDGVRVCVDCVPPAAKHRLWRWQESAREYEIFTHRRTKMS